MSSTHFSFYFLNFNWWIITLQNCDGFSHTSAWIGHGYTYIWAWVWVNSGSWWWTGRHGVIRFMGSQRVGHDWATELNWTELIHIFFLPPEPSCPPFPSRLLQSNNFNIFLMKIIKDRSMIYHWSKYMIKHLHIKMKKNLKSKSTNILKEAQGHDIIALYRKMGFPSCLNW